MDQNLPPPSQGIWDKFKGKLGIKNNNDLPEDKVKLFNLLLEFDFGIHLLAVGLLIFVVILILAWKFDFTNYFQNKYQLKSNSVEQAITTVNFTPKSNRLADSQAPYINQQIVSIEKAFTARPNKVKLTINGQIKKEVFGFLPYWALAKIDEIDTSMLTTVSYFGLEVGGDGSIVTSSKTQGLDEGWRMWNDKKLDDFFKKMKRSRIKTLVTIKCFDQENIKKIVKSPESFENFINNAIYLMSSKGLDGITLDFEYIGEPDQEVIDGFSILVNSLNKEMKRQYPNSILNISTFATAASTKTLHDVEILAQNSDYLVIMGYDFSTPNSSQAGAIAPMDGAGYSLSSSMNSYLEKVKADKLVLAVAYYGYDWPVEGVSSNAKVVGGKEFVKIYPYGEIIEATKNKNISWDDNSLTPWYSYTDSQTKQIRVVHFENTRSLGIKYDFINQKNLRGVGIWALGFDGKNNDLLQLLADKFAN